MAEKELRVRPNGDLRAVTDADGRRAIEGYAIRFNEPSEDLGGFIEYIAPGAVKLDDDLRAFFDHQSQYVLGRSTVGTLETRTDDNGVWMKAYPPETQWANDLLTSIERGDISGMSFGFFLNDDAWEKRDGKAVRTVTDADVFELSVVAMPAYPTTSAYARDKASALLEEPEERDSEDDAPGAESELTETPGVEDKPVAPKLPNHLI